MLVVFLLDLFPPFFQNSQPKFFCNERKLSFTFFCDERKFSTDFFANEKLSFENLATSSNYWCVFFPPAHSHLIKKKHKQKRSFLCTIFWVWNFPHMVWLSSSATLLGATLHSGWSLKLSGKNSFRDFATLHERSQRPQNNLSTVSPPLWRPSMLCYRAVE